MMKSSRLLHFKPHPLDRYIDLVIWYFWHSLGFQYHKWCVCTVFSLQPLKPVLPSICDNKHNLQLECTQPPRKWKSRSQSKCDFQPVFTVSTNGEKIRSYWQINTLTVFQKRMWKQTRTASHTYIYSRNQLTFSSFFCCVSTCVVTGKQLTSLSLRTIPGTKSEQQSVVRYFKGAVHTHQTFRELRLALNKLERIPKGISNLRNLQLLDLSSNFFQKQSLQKSHCSIKEDLSRIWYSWTILLLKPLVSDTNQNTTTDMPPLWSEKENNLWNEAISLSLKDPSQIEDLASGLRHLLPSILLSSPLLDLFQSGKQFKIKFPVLFTLCSGKCVRRLKMKLDLNHENTFHFERRYWIILGLSWYHFRRFHL